MKNFSKIFIIALLLSSCKAKVIKTEIQRDTIYKNKIVKITPPSVNEIKIENVCDSLGNLKEVKYITKQGKVKTIVKTLENTLYLQIDTDSIKDIAVSEYKSTLKDKKETIIKFRVPKWAWYSLLINAILLAWIFRKPLFRIIKPI